MGAPDAVLELVERFERNRAQYLNPAYNETQVRREFLDPFFTALGWDVDNTHGYAQAYKDVVHEDAIRVGLDTRAPDYSFRIGGQRKFFVEAKKPAVNLKDDPAPAYQLRRYAWSAKLPLSLLTDFNELAVYDGRVKPAASDKPSAARTLYVPCAHYDERWEEIASVFSKEAILQGSFDRYAESTKAKKGTAEVDKAFLGEIELWRDALARNIAPLVFINTVDGKAAQMFTLAHELAHVWFAQSAAFDLRDMQPARAPIEQACNKVAAEFLVPEAEMRVAWPTVRGQDRPFDELARRFKVSTLVAARRALDLQLIDRDGFFAFYADYRDDARRQDASKASGGNFWATQEGRIGRCFGEAVVRATQEGRLLYRDAYVLTDLRGGAFTHYAERLEAAGRR